MPAITIAQAQAKVAEYLAAETAILEGKEVRLGGQGGLADRFLRLEDLQSVREGRMEWERRLASLEARQDQRLPTLGGLTYTVARFDC